MCICDPMRGVTCAGHAEQARAAATGRPLTEQEALDAYRGQDEQGAP